MENQFSKIILGTVQLGMSYGVGRWANELMPENEAFRILDAAWEMGITTLDTSPDYGLAEMRVAKYMKANPAKCFQIISKIKNVSLDSKDDDCWFKDWLSHCSFLSLHNCASISILLHREQTIQDLRVCGILSEAVVSGQINQWGLSAYGIDAVSLAAGITDCKIVQLPFSPINQSFGRNGMLAKLEELEKTVIARSVFAQGRLIKLIDENSTDHGVDERMIVELRDFLSVENLSITDFAVGFALSERGVTNVVLGADSADQINSWASAMPIVPGQRMPCSLSKQLRSYDGKLGKPHLW